jgi:hypothetical protein
MSNQLLYDSEAQIFGMFPIHGIGDAESPPDWVETFVDSHAFEKLARDFPELAGLFEASNLSSREMATEVAERWSIVGRTGFIVEAYVNARTYQRGCTSFFSGPGHQQIYWFYVCSADNAVPELIKLAEEQHARSRAKAGAA